MAKQKTTRIFDASLKISLVDTEETGRDDVEVEEIIGQAMEFVRKALLVDLSRGSRVPSEVEGPLTVAVKSNRYFEVECTIENTSKGCVSSKR